MNDEGSPRVRLSEPDLVNAELTMKGNMRLGSQQKRSTMGPTIVTRGSSQARRGLDQDQGEPLEGQEPSAAD